MEQEPDAPEFADELLEFPMLGSLSDPPDIRARLHAICALYAYTRNPADRLALMDRLEDLTLETAHLLAVDLLENGWMPTEAPAVQSADRGRLRVVRGSDAA